MFLAKGTVKNVTQKCFCVKALGQAKSCVFGPAGTIPGLDLPVQDEGGEKQKLAQVGPVWPDLEVWMLSWWWGAMEGIGSVEGHPRPPGFCVEEWP